MKNKIYILPFHSDFLKFIAELLLEENSEGDFSQTLLVFPGRRPALYIKKYIQDTLKSPFIPPFIFSMDDFVRFIFNKIEPAFTEGNPLDFAWYLYKINRDRTFIITEKSDSNFPEFLPYAFSLLKAVEELDIELVPDNRIKNIPCPSARTADKNTISLLDVREKIHEFIQSSKKTTRGFMYRTSAERIAECDLNNMEKIFLCGHYALTASEIKLFKFLIENRGAEFYTQLETPSDIFQNVCEKLNADLEVIEKPQVLPSRIKYYSAPDIHLEVQKAGECILNESLNPSETAVVIPDDSSLIPFLNTVLTRVDFDYNVTMGIPLTRTAHFALIENLITAQQNLSEEGYYARDYLNIIMHPYVKNIGVEGNPRISQILMRKIEEFIIKTGKTFVKLEEVENGTIPAGGSVLAETIDVLQKIDPSIEISVNELQEYLHHSLHRYFFYNFEKVDSFASFLINLKDAFKLIVNSEKALSYPLSRDIFTKVFELIESFLKLNFAKEKLNKNEILQLALKIFRNERIPFEGIPLMGLQVLGLLETRNLRFKNLILLNINEGILPKSNKYDPILNNAIRKELGLPTYVENDEIYRYHFYRLIKGCEVAHIFYIENDELIRSRFVEELIWEEQKRTKRLEEHCTEEITIQTVVMPEPFPEIKKDGLTIKKIIRKATERGLSPTSLDKYLNCPLSFYYLYVLGLQEKEELKQEIDAKVIGTLVHKILEDFFKPFEGKKLELNVEFHKKELKRIIEHYFVQFFPYGNKGEFYLLKKIIEFRLEKFFNELLKRDISSTEVIKTENELFADFRVNESSVIKLTGHIDLIEKTNDSYMITDYKTGEIENIKPHIKKLTGFSRPLRREEARKFIRSFQLPVYLYLLSKDRGVDDWEKLNAQIYDIRQNKPVRLFNSSQNGETTRIMEEVILPTLKNIIAEIISPDVPFIKDDSNQKGCTFCQFSVLCRKI